MTSNLSTIGFAFTDDESFAATMVKLANAAQQRLVTERGEYAIWRSRTGAEIWFHLGDDGESSGERDIIGLTPFYEGESAVRIAATETLKRPDDNALEGLVHAWVDPDSTGVGSYPLVYDAVDFAALADRELPSELTCRIAAFCRELTLFDSVEALTASEPAGDGPGLAPQSLVPIGLFEASDDDPEDLPVDGPDDEEEGESEPVPTPTILVRGTVKSHRRHVNEITGHAFHWMLVETLDAVIDVIAEDEIVTGEPHEGSAIEAYAWLFGRMLVS